MTRSATDRAIRRALVEELDRRVGQTEWVGNKVELGYQVSGVSDYMALAVLRKFGVYLGRGQYRVTRQRFNEVCK